MKGAVKPKRIRRILILCTEIKDDAVSLGQPGSSVKLIREPTYPNDRWAIQVFSQEGKILGYIPFAKNQSAARLMDAGRSITGEIMSDSLRVAIYLETEVQSEEEKK